MNQEQLFRARALLKKIQREPDAASLHGGFDLMRDVVRPLLESDGYEVMISRFIAEGGMAYVAGYPIGEYEFRPVVGVGYRDWASTTAFDRLSLNEFVRACAGESVKRGVVVSPAVFPAQVIAISERDFPVEVEFLDPSSLAHWLDRAGRSLDEEEKCLVEALRHFARSLAKVIAANPRHLWQIEWRDLERLLAEVFETLGFRTTLTPASGDGGKDIILECLIRGQRRSYIVEVKHWVSGKRVGPSQVWSFVHVVARESRSGGLMIASRGFSDRVLESIVEIERRRVRLGTEEKVVSLCRSFVRAESGVWSPGDPLAEVIHEDLL